MNLIKLLEKAAYNRPLKAAIIHEDGREITFQSLHRRALKLANYFQGISLQKGDHVLIWLPNCVEWIVAYWALMKIGAVAILVNEMARRFELEHIMADTKPKLLITQQKFLDLLASYEDIDQASLKKLNIHGTEMEKALFLDLPEDPVIDLPTADLRPDHPAAVIYTAASEGTALGAVLSHNNLLAAIVSAQNSIYVGGNDCLATVLPFYHAYGLNGFLGISALREVPIYLTTKFNTIQLKKIIQDSPVTFFMGVPLMFALLPKLFKPGEDLSRSRIQSWVVAGDKMPVEIMQTCKEQFGIVIREGYGLTESCPNGTVSNYLDPVKFGSVGRAFANVHAEVVDSQGRPLPANEEGEIVLSGENIFLGYLNQPEITAKVLRDGRLFTGDKGYMDREGYFYITGRIKSLLINNGLNVYPREVEKYLKRHPAVERAEISSTRNIVQGDIIQARVWLKSGITLSDTALSDWCMDNFASYKVPKMIEIQ